MSSNNISELGKSTRFGQPDGADPRVARNKANPPWSIRRAARRIAAMTFDYDKPPSLEDILKIFDPKLKAITPAEYLAAKTIYRGLLGDANALIWATNAIDGKLPTKENRVRATTLEDLVNGI